MKLQQTIDVKIFCSIATHSAFNDLYSLILSLSLTNPGSKLYLITDSAVKLAIEKRPIIGDIQIYWRIELDEFTNKNRKIMEAEGSFGDFLMTKMRAIEFALENEESVMFLDSDIFVMDKIELTNYSGQPVSLSRHHINQADENRFGVFNAGALWTNSSEVPKIWRNNISGSRFDDQAALEAVAAELPVHLMHQGQNLSWWRLFQGNASPAELVNHLTITDDGKIKYRGDIVQFIHVHLKTTSEPENLFSAIMLKTLAQTKSIKLLLLFLRGMAGQWTVSLPSLPRPDKAFEHAGDTFRELVSLWEEFGYCNITYENSNHCWFGPVEGCLLYDRPNLDWFDDEAKTAAIGLFGNPAPPFSNSKPWIFWPRSPRAVEAFVNRVSTYKKFSDREVHSIFIGNIENSVQGDYREDTWQDVVEGFELTRSQEHKFSQEEYLIRISNAKFGLCLRGFGPKCNREIELLALGTVPVITPECDVNSYNEPLIEGVHYLRVDSPGQFSEVVSPITESRWSVMSKAGQKWWQRNCSVEGSFNTTIRTIFN